MRTYPKSLLLVVLLPIASWAAPTLTRQPVDTNVVAGQTVALSSAATGSGTLTYQWHRRGVAVPGATDASLVIAAASRSDMGYYAVTVTDNTGSVTSAPAAVNVAPTRYTNVAAADVTYDLDLESTKALSINALVPLPDGGFYAGGWLASVDGLPRHLICRINADATLNTSFVPDDIHGQSVSTIAVQTDGKLLIAGAFTRIGAERRSGFARLNADGTLDRSFAPVLEGVDQVTQFLIRPDGKIYLVCGGTMPIRRLNADGTVDSTWTFPIYSTATAAALLADGNIVFYGYVPLLDGQNSYHLVRMHADGTLDQTFAPPALGGYVATIGEDANHRLLVGGAYSVNGSSQYQALVRLLPDGTLDNTFIPANTGLIKLNSVMSINVQPDGKLVLGGNVIESGGTTQSGVVRLNSDGSVDNTYVPGQPGVFVNTVAVLADGEILAGVQRRLTSDPSAPTGIASYAPNGALDFRFHLNMRGNDYATAIAPLPEQKTLVFGTFDLAGGKAVPGILRLNADNTIDQTFHATAPVVRPGGEVRYAWPLPDGRVLIAGRLNIDDTAPGAQIAMLKSDLTVDPSIVFTSGGRSYLGAIALGPDGRIYAYGAKVTSLADNSTQTINVITRYNLDATIDSTYLAPSDVPQFISAMVVQRDGKVILSGNSNTGSGILKSIVRLNADGSHDSSFNADSSLVNVAQLNVLPDGKILVTGGFIADGYITRLNADGTADPTFTRTAIGYPRAVLVQENGAILVRTSSSNSMPHGEFMARILPDGGFDPTFRAQQLYQPSGGTLDLNGSMSAILVHDDGRLLIGDEAGDITPMTILPSPPTITTAPTSQIVDGGGNATLSVIATGDTPLAYQWSLNGTAIAGATSSTYPIANFGLSSAGQYTVTVTNPAGSVTSDAVSVAPPALTRGHLINLSIRAMAGAGDNRLIVGVVLGGDRTEGKKALLIRGVGPSLGAYHITGFLPDPMLEVYDNTGTKIDQNDDWNGTFPFSAVGAFPFSGPAPKDAAIYNPNAVDGIQTAHVIGKDGTLGVAMAEIYDATSNDAFTTLTPRMINGSARTAVGTGDNALILGFAIGGSTSERLLIRAAGPTLGGAPYNVSGVLADPSLEIYAGQSRLASNDNWGDGGNAGQLAAAFDAVSAFPFSNTTSRDSALIITLQPGLYSAVVRGNNNTTGVAIVELYELP